MATPNRQVVRRNRDRTLTEAIAKETETPLAEVERLYDAELRELASDAKITQYLGVIAGRRVKMKLRKH